jgi:DNA-binding NarL/FixJ family response regulator
MTVVTPLPPASPAAAPSTVHVLFVDDDTRVLDGLRRLLYEHRNDWAMAFALGGEAALRALEDAAGTDAARAAAPFDVVVTDLRMPGMDGAALLRTVHARWPRVVRIVLSGQTDQATMLRTVRVAHQCLAKPCDAGVLHDAVTRAFRLRDLLSDEALRTIVGGVDALPHPPPRLAANL